MSGSSGARKLVKISWVRWPPAIVKTWPVWNVSAVGVDFWGTIVVWVILFPNRLSDNPVREAQGLAPVAEGH
jgi:hypothetical protein